MASLYDIDYQLQMLEDYMVDIETGEILSDEEFNKKFDEIQMALEDKIENTICFVKNLNADIEAFKIEQKKLMDRRKVKENLAERLQNRIDNYIRTKYTDEDGNVNLNELNKFKMETPKMKISYRKSDSVHITDLSQIDSIFIKDRVIKEDDVKKTDIKSALKSGLQVSGAELVTNVNMQIK